MLRRSAGLAFHPADPTVSLAAGSSIRAGFASGAACHPARAASTAPTTTARVDTRVAGGPTVRAGHHHRTDEYALRDGPHASPGQGQKRGPGHGAQLEPGTMLHDTPLSRRYGESTVQSARHASFCAVGDEAQTAASAGPALQ
jgi:hypothetical protein